MTFQEVSLQNSSLVFGEAIALVEAKNKYDIDFGEYKDHPEDIDRLENIYKLYNEQKANGRHQAYPNGVCPSENPFLKKNEECLITHLLLYDSLPNKVKVQRLFIKHLNDCYWCFKFYSQVLKDYHWARREIEAKLGETK